MDKFVMRKFPIGCSGDLESSLPRWTITETLGWWIKHHLLIIMSCLHWEDLYGDECFVVSDNRQAGESKDKEFEREKVQQYHFVALVFFLKFFDVVVFVFAFYSSIYNLH